MSDFINPISEQLTIREFAAKHGMPQHAGFITMTDSQGEQFESNGVSFGVTFVVFSKNIMDEHPGNNAFEIAKDILQNASKYQIIAKSGVAWKNGNPIYCLCHMGSKLQEVGGSLAEFCQF